MSLPNSLVQKGRPKTGCQHDRTGNCIRLPSWKLTYPIPAGTFESMIFLFPRWDMLVPWRVFITCHESLQNMTRTFWLVVLFWHEHLCFTFGAFKQHQLIRDLAHFCEIQLVIPQYPHPQLFPEIPKRRGEGFPTPQILPQDNLPLSASKTPKWRPEEDIGTSD